MPKHALLLAALALALPLAAAGEGGVEDSVREAIGLDSLARAAGERLSVTADHMGADHKTGRVTLEGNVRMRFADVTLTCDRATYDQATGDVHAQGDVRLRSLSGGSWAGESLSFNHRTGAGLMGAGLVRLGAFGVKAPEGAARDDEGTLHAKNVTLTTCVNEAPEDWHWSVTGTGRYRQGEFLELRNATARLFGLPLLWAPYYYRDLNTHYGWRILPGYSGDWGAYLRLGYVYPIAGSLAAGRHLYGKSQLDLRSERGVGVGQELTWNTEGGLFGEGTRQWGRLSLYYAYDIGDQEAADRNWNSTYDENRWTIGLKERLDFSPRDFLHIEGEKVSDSQFRGDYNEAAVRASSQPLGVANYEHRENAWVTSLALMGPLDTFYAGVRRLPELRLDLLPQRLLGIDKLYYESQTAAGYLRRQPAKYDAAFTGRYTYDLGNWAYYDTFRLDTRHLIRRPIALAQGLTLTPRLGWRGTYYADSPDGSSLFRSLFELGATLQARLWRDYGRHRHTLTPYLDLTYVPGSQDGPQDQPYAFDRLDQEYEWRDRYRSDGLTPTHRYAGLRFGLKNTLQRRNPDTGLLSPLLDADLYGVWVFQTQDHWTRWRRYEQPGRGNLAKPARRVKEDTGLRVIGLEATYKPFRHLTLVNDFQYDPENSRLALWDVTLRYALDPITLYAGYLRRHHDLYDYYWADEVKDELVHAGFIHHLCDLIDYSAYARYNLEHSDLDEIGGFIQYNLDCLSFRLNTRYLPKYYSDDGWKHGSEFRISFELWLRAFPKEETEGWMDWASIADY